LGVFCEDLLFGILTMSAAARKKKIRVLVCSANLGNEQPDADSLRAWIPEDGNCLEVLKEPHKYPLPNVEDAVEDISDQDRFDLVVIGMQESTFEPPGQDNSQDADKGSDTNGTDTDSKPDAENDSSSQPAILQKTADISSKVVKKTVDAGKNVAVKGISTVTTLTANRDHTKHNVLINPADWSSGTTVLHKLLSDRLPSYEKIVSYQRGEMRLEILKMPDLQTKTLSVKAQNTGMAGLANKGKMTGANSRPASESIC